MLLTGFQFCPLPLAVAPHQAPAIHLPISDAINSLDSKDLLQKNDEGALKALAQKVIDANPKVVADYNGGKETAIMGLVGSMMKETKGSANPTLARQILIDLLK